MNDLGRDGRAHVLTWCIACIVTQLAMSCSASSPSNVGPALVPDSGAVSGPDDAAVVAPDDASVVAPDGGAVADAAIVPHASTYVSLTFDDSRSSQRNAAALLEARGVRGTFYINSAMLGSSAYYMTLDEVRAIAAGGHEIGGHTSTHVDLTKARARDVAREVCEDQVRIQAWGFAGISMAYPFGATNAAVQSVVRDCRSLGYQVSANYVSARVVGTLQCSGCPDAESVPPANPFAVRTPGGSPTNATTLAELEAMVTKAEATGGWIVFPFHSVCAAPSAAPAPGDAPDCKDEEYAIRYDTLDAFVAWLAARESAGTHVARVQDVMSPVALSAL